MAKAKESAIIGGDREWLENVLNRAVQKGLAQRERVDDFLKRLGGAPDDGGDEPAEEERGRR